MKKFIFLALFTFATLCAVPARAQSGCDDSPENPTLILAGLAAGTYGVSTLRSKFNARRSGKTSKPWR